MKKFLYFLALAICFAFQFNLPNLNRRTKDTIKKTRQNMPKKLKACKTLTQVEALLREEEKEALEAIKQAFNISNKWWKEYIDEVNRSKHFFRSKYFKQSRHVYNHSLRNTDSTLYKQIVTVLKRYGINPYAIDIVYDKQFHEKHPNCPAYTVVAYTETKNDAIEATLSFFPEPKKSLLYTHCCTIAPLHECMHLWEVHSIQIQRLLSLLIHLGHISLDLAEDQFYKHPMIMKWQKKLEKIADLLPLLKFKDHVHIKTMYEELLCGEICYGSEIHPDNNELLPWVLKIKEIMGIKDTK
ncbi:MAG TPA: hypothetical protein VGW78_05860 [Candidatus Babeliales bacterium]|nr:hypothetical protein [Candidatus Babeliales bacterium]